MVSTVEPGTAIARIDALLAVSGRYIPVKR
jgi:hypothetical protein